MAGERGGGLGWVRRLAWLVLWLGVAARAEIQFDVFVGFDDRVREGDWFPVAFEILNDGPPINGTVLFGPDSSLESEPRIFPIELPTGTRKRVVIPAFSPRGQYARWEARLLDGSGKMVAERDNLAPRGVQPGLPMLGALPRSFGGLPTFPEVPNRGPETLPAVVRLQADYLPTNPIALEALTAIYLNSERAADLRPEHVDALLGWLHQGGHLIVGIEQAAEVTALPWLRGLIPFAPDGATNVPVSSHVESWLGTGKAPIRIAAPARRNPQAPMIRRGAANRPGRAATTNAPPTGDPADVYATVAADGEFGAAKDFAVVAGRNLGGEVLLTAGGLPLMISAPRGRGTVTVLAFSPERDPFRSWKNRSYFWARVVGVPGVLLAAPESFRWGGLSIDGIFGAMLDSRQVRKLPVPALLALLLVYLVVIGPFDQWILKRTGKQMWTWITFPVYVVLFSGLIYFIGYRLRAGDLEWNEIQVVDQLPRAEGAALRGRTWATLYSPSNARYRFASEQPFATFRAEFSMGGRMGAESSRVETRLPAKGFDAGAQVPVWINQLFVSDWLDAGPVLVAGRVARDAAGEWTGVVENRSDLAFERVVVAHGGRLHDFGEMTPGQRRERKLPSDGGTALNDLVGGLSQASMVVNQRRSAFGGERSGIMDRNLDGVLLASFAERGSTLGADMATFFSPAGFDASRVVDRGEAMVFAWAPKQSVAAAIQRFAPTRMQRDTVVRAVLPTEASSMPPVSPTSSPRQP